MIVRVIISGAGEETVELFTTEELNEMYYSILSFIRRDRGDQVTLGIFWRDQCNFEFPSWLLSAINYHGKALCISCYEEPEPEFEYLGDSIDTGDVELIQEQPDED